ncbi:hypothetical protein BJP62_02865 [Jeongeupia sp. USM3]|nr:hypothetical protein BJP62_02865 [Jeongeupia sp. USM3]
MCYGIERELDQREGHAVVTALQRLYPGRVACLQESGGFVNNLRVWENLILPAWYHESASLPVLEARLVAAMDALAIPADGRAALTAALPAALSKSQRRELALARSLVQSPDWLAVETEWLVWLNGAASVACKEVYGALALRCPVLLFGAGALQHAEPLPDTGEENAVTQG